MSMSDPIADMLIRISNASRAGHPEVRMPASRMKAAIAAVLKDEGYIENCVAEAAGPGAEMTVTLKYFEGRPVISKLRRISRPSLRVYRGKGQAPKALGGLGIAIVSTSRGVMSDHAAAAAGHGGEIICTVE